MPHSDPFKLKFSKWFTITCHEKRNGDISYRLFADGKPILKSKSNIESLSDVFTFLRATLPENKKAPFIRISVKLKLRGDTYSPYQRRPYDFEESE